MLALLKMFKPKNCFGEEDVFTPPIYNQLFWNYMRRFNAVSLEKRYNFSIVI